MKFTVESVKFTVIRGRIGGMSDFERDRSGLGIASWRTDGYPHERDENGFCGNCGASKNEYHYRLKPREDAPNES